MNKNYLSLIVFISIFQYTLIQFNIEKISIQVKIKNNSEIFWS